MEQTKSIEISCDDIKKTAQLILKFYELNEKARKDDLSALKDSIDTCRKNYRDIFEYGILLCVNGIESGRLEKILTNLILTEKNEQEKRFKTLQKEAVMQIQKGKHSRLFLYSLYEFFDFNEIKEIQNCFNDSDIYNDFEFLLEKPSLSNSEEIFTDSSTLCETQMKPFKFFHEADDNVLLEQLRLESPHVIASVLAMLEHKKAAYILSNFEDLSKDLNTNIKSDITYNVAVMDIPKIDLLCDILKFEKKLLSISKKNYKCIDNSEFEKLLKMYLIRKNTVEKVLELYKKASSVTAGNQEALELTNKLMQAMRGKPIDFLNANISNFIMLLKEEHPKTIAYILSFLEPKHACIMLSLLPEYVQCDVALHIVLMDKNEIVTPQMRESAGIISPEEISSIEKKLSVMLNKKYELKGGIEALVNILNLADRKTERTIIDYIIGIYPELTELIFDYMFLFEDIVMLDDRAIQKTMREVDSEELAIALKDENEEVQDKMFKNMSKRAAFLLKEDMDWMDPVSPEETVNVKKKIVSIIRHLEETGEIVIARAGEDEIVI